VKNESKQGAGNKPIAVNLLTAGVGCKKKRKIERKRRRRSSVAKSLAVIDYDLFCRAESGTCAAWSTLIYPCLIKAE
jgi:hypothetical protein